MTTHKIDPALVREVLGYANKEVIEIKIEDEKCIRLVINQNALFDVIDIHRFKDLAIEWCAGKGWDMIIYPNEIAVMLPIADPKSDGRPRMIFRIVEGLYPDKLSAELAAISFVWEQIQKEKKDEN